MTKFGRFLYRQKQRALYYISSSSTRRFIAEINQFEKKIAFREKGYFIQEIGLLVPKTGYDFIFQPNTFYLLSDVLKGLRGRYEFREDRLLFNYSDLSIEITSKSELFILNEIFVNRCYQFFLPNNGEVHLIDIGMNVGLASLFFAGLPYVQKVYAFEPFGPTFRQALRNFEANPIRAAKIEVYNFGLGDHEEELTVDYNPINKGINTSINNNNRNGCTRKEKISIKSAGDVLNALMRQSPEKNFVIKIDAEGSEYAILESLSKDKLCTQIKGMMIEWHFRGPETLEKMLLGAGFTLTSMRLNINSGLIYAFR